MKVLWFANTPCNSSEYLNDLTLGGGWLKTLDESIQNYVDLSIAFYYKKNIPSFKYLNTTYYPINSINLKINSFKNIIIKNVLDIEDINIYLSIIDTVKPDLIHIHGTENSFNCIIDKVDIPIIVSIQGNITVYNHKYDIGFSKDLLKIKHSNKAFSIKKYLFNRTFYSEFLLFTKMALRECKYLYKTKYILGRTDWDKRITSILAPNSIYFHADEILRPEFYERVWTSPHSIEKYIIHSTTGNSPYKGFETVCEALFLLRKLDINIEWRIAGINEHDLIVKITKKKLGNRYPQSGLVLMGKLTSKEIVQKLCESNLYVMPSHIENSPNNLCEAMILGMPCIATFAGGTSSILNNGVEGILIQDGDPWALAGTILELNQNIEQSIKLGKAARKSALERHNKYIITIELINVYNEILKLES